ncbi:MAG: hypothetical protein ACRDXX_22190 [Stackebrandtia sp.]
MSEEQNDAADAAETSQSSDSSAGASGDQEAVEAPDPGRRRSGWIVGAAIASALALGTAAALMFTSDSDGDETASDGDAQEAADGGQDDPADAAPDSGDYTVVSVSGGDCLRVSSYQDPNTVNTMEYLPVIATGDCSEDASALQVEKRDADVVWIHLAEEPMVEGHCVSTVLGERDFVTPQPCEDAEADEVDLRVRPADEGRHRLETAAGECLAISDEETSHGYGVQLEKCSDAETQLFEWRAE